MSSYGENLAIAYLLSQDDADMGLAGRHHHHRGGRRNARAIRARTEGAAQITGAATEGLARVIEAIGGARRARTGADQGYPPAGAPGAPGAPGAYGPDDPLGPGVQVSTPWGKIAIGGVFGLVLIGGIVYLVSASKRPAVPAQAAA